MAVAFLRLCGLSTVEPGDGDVVTILAPSDLAEGAELWPHIIPTGDYGLQRDLTSSIALTDAHAGRRGLWRIADLTHYRRWCDDTGEDPADTDAWQRYPGVATIASDTPRSAYAIPLVYHMARMASALAIEGHGDPIALMEASDTIWDLSRRIAGVATSRYGLLLGYLPVEPEDGGPIGCELQLCAPADTDPDRFVCIPDAAERAAGRLVAVLGLGYRVDLGIIAFTRNAEVSEIQQRRAPGSWYQYRLEENQLQATKFGAIGEPMVFSDDDGPWASGVLVSGNALALLWSAMKAEPTA